MDRLPGRLVVQLERIDTDQIFYELYSILLKTKVYLERLDFDKSMVPRLNKIILSLKKPYLLLTCGKWPTLMKAFNIALEKMKGPGKEKFWKSLSEVYGKCMKNLLKEFRFPSLVRKDIQDNMLYYKPDIVGEENNWGDLFKINYGNTGKKYFKATQFMKKHQKLNSGSIFQPNFDFIDFKFLIHSLSRYLSHSTSEKVDELKPIFAELFEDVELTPIDYGLLKETYTRVMKTVLEVLDRLEKTN